MELNLITSKRLHLGHMQTWPTRSCIGVTVDTGVTGISPVACLKPTGSNVVMLFDGLHNAYTGGG